MCTCFIRYITVTASYLVCVILFVMRSRIQYPYILFTVEQERENYDEIVNNSYRLQLLVKNTRSFEEEDTNEDG